MTNKQSQSMFSIHQKIANWTRYLLLMISLIICQNSFSQDCIDPGIQIEPNSVNPDPGIEPDPNPSTIDLEVLLAVAESMLEDVENDLAEMEDYECYNYSEFVEDYGPEAAEEMIEDLTEQNQPERDRLEELRDELEEVIDDAENAIEQRDMI